MNLFSSIENAYTREHLSAREAQRLAEFIAFGPIVFQVSRLMVKFGILEKLRENGVPAAAVEVEFLDMAGDAVTERTDAAALLALGDAVSRRTTVYLRGGAEQLAPAKAAAEALAPSGMWWLYAADYPENVSAADCRAFNRDKPDAVQSDSFRLGVE